MDLRHTRTLIILSVLAEKSLNDRLVLKGGTALELAHGIAARGSVDVDLSMPGDFAQDELAQVAAVVERSLGDRFQGEGLTVFAYSFSAITRPGSQPDPMPWWGGYCIIRAPGSLRRSCGGSRRTRSRWRPLDEHASPSLGVGHIPVPHRDLADHRRVNLSGLEHEPTTGACGIALAVDDAPRPVEREGADDDGLAPGINVPVSRSAKHPGAEVDLIPVVPGIDRILDGGEVSGSVGLHDVLGRECGQAYEQADQDTPAPFQERATASKAHGQNSVRTVGSAKRCRPGSVRPRPRPSVPGGWGGASPRSTADRSPHVRYRWPPAVRP